MLLLWQMKLNGRLAAAMISGALSTLSRYQRRRKPDNLATMAAMEGFKRLFGADQLGLRLVRNMGMSKLNGLPAVKNTIIKKAMGL